mmetsp:Transcript_38449/g.109914  ORF Transcript_38449/g.109914 Transcript_38449/m.109914 type:complete len:669 (-) Transcript_38449:76-2082(-)
MVVPSLIETGTKKLDIARKKGHRLSLELRRRLGVVIVTLCLLVAASTWLARSLVLLVSIIYEIGVSASPRLRLVQATRPWRLFGTYTVLQLILLTLMETRFTLPTTVAVESSKSGQGGGSGEQQLVLNEQPPAAAAANPAAGVKGVVVDEDDDTLVIEEEPAAGPEQISIVVPVRDEELYLTKTIEYTVNDTPAHMLREILIVDDASDKPVEKMLEEELDRKYWPKVKILRYDERQGLIRARIAGADAASAPYILFLDGHCRPIPGWLPPLIRNLKENYKRIVVPIVSDVNGTTWQEIPARGVKMMFEWDFNFNWYDDNTPEVPVASGGILAITKQWWIESGKYDPGMREWGGENIEQSIRVWLCGGEIIVERNSRIGHIFKRPPKPNKITIPNQVQRNHARAAKVWLDDYYKYFVEAQPMAKTLDLGPGLEQRMALRPALKCKDFQWYVDKFRHAFERKGLLMENFHHLRHTASRLCLTAVEADKDKPKDDWRHKDHLILEPCKRPDDRQRWSTVGGNRMLFNRKVKKCLDRFSIPFGNEEERRPILWECDWLNVPLGKNQNQLWQHDQHPATDTPKHDGAHEPRTGHVFAVPNGFNGRASRPGEMELDPGLATDSGSLCLTAKLLYHEAFQDKKLRRHGHLPTEPYLAPCRPVTDDPWQDTQGWEP